MMNIRLRLVTSCFKDFKAQINDDDSIKADVIANAVTTVKYHGIMGCTDNVSTQAHLLGRFITKRKAMKARKAGEERYFGKYR